MQTQQTGLKVAIAGSNQLELVGMQALLENTGEAGVRLVFCEQESPPSIDSFAEADIVCFDFDSPGLELERLTHAIKSRFEGAAVVWISRDQQDRGQFSAIRAGADGFTDKARITDILDAFQTVSSGDYYFCPHVLMRYIKHICLMVPNRSRLQPSLSARENEVLTLVQSGATNMRIADTLNISTETVKVHLRHIRKALDINNRN